MTIINVNNITGINSISAQSSSVTFYNSTGGTASIAASVTGNITGNVNSTGISTFLGSIGINTSNPVQQFQVGSGTSVVIIDSLGDVGIGTTNPTSSLHIVGGDSRFNGVTETVSAATTYLSGNALVLEMNVRQSTVYTYTIPTGANIGIVSFKDVPAQSGNASVSTLTLLLTQNAAGTGNTTPTTGIGTNCTVVGYSTGASVAGISTIALVSAGTTVTISSTGNDVDIVSFLIHYTGESNTDANSYKIYVNDVSGFRSGNIGI